MLRIGERNMEPLKPKLFWVMKDYTKDQFVKDVISGIIVAIIALPLSMALALASGVEPQLGIYTAIIASIVTTFLGGSRVQITGPTAALATMVAGVVAEYGMNGLLVATIMAGIILVVMGFLRLGNLIKFIPYTITLGFTAGIAFMIFVGQIASFIGVDTRGYKGPTIETMDKLKALFSCIETFNPVALVIGIVSLAILIVWPKINKTIPSYLVVVVIASAIVKIGGIDSVNTIGKLYPNLSGELPKFTVPSFSFGLVEELLPTAFTIAMLSAIVTLLSAVVTDALIGSKHNSNMELIGQGVGAIVTGFFGGIPGTGAVARTTANAKNGARTPIACLVHSITLLIMLVLLIPYAKLIPMPTIGAILFIVSYNMSGIKNIINTVKRSPKSDTITLFVTFFMAIIFDLVVAIVFGLILACVLFLKRMTEVTEIKGWNYVDQSEGEEHNYMELPKGTLVFEITGPLFFGACDKLNYILGNTDVDRIILRMRGVNAMDSTAIHTFDGIIDTCKKNNITLIFSHVNEQPMSVMKKSGFVELIGEENFCENITASIDRAYELAGERRKNADPKAEEKKNDENIVNQYRLK